MATCYKYWVMTFKEATTKNASREIKNMFESTASEKG